MARVTVEDCIDKVDSPYELVLVAKERATQLNSGLEPTLDRDNDKNTVIALREIAEEKIERNFHCSQFSNFVSIKENVDKINEEIFREKSGPCRKVDHRGCIAR